MPKDIVEAYALAVKARESCTRKAFEEVINFCENDLQCSADNSRKRNTLLLWSYDKLAQSMARTNQYAKAYEWWQKALPLTSSVKVKINLSLNMLDAANKGFANMREKAAKVAETTALLQKLYQKSNDLINSQKMQKLTETATNLLIISKAKN